MKLLGGKKVPRKAGHLDFWSQLRLELKLALSLWCDRFAVSTVPTKRIPQQPVRVSEILSIAFGLVIVVHCTGWTDSFEI